VVLNSWVDNTFSDLTETQRLRVKAAIHRALPTDLRNARARVVDMLYGLKAQHNEAGGTIEEYVFLCSLFNLHYFIVSLLITCFYFIYYLLLLFSFLIFYLQFQPS
jgi:hypothetical protein